MKIKRESITSFWKAGISVAIAIAFILPGSAMFTNDFSHYVCESCGAELNPDTMYGHKCRRIK